jgi:hypothetical protein
MTCGAGVVEVVVFPRKLKVVSNSLLTPYFFVFAKKN